MKKVLFITVACLMAISFTACKKTCKCTEKKTKVSQTMTTDSKYKSCADIQDLFKSKAKGTGQSWTCKETK